MHGANGYMGVNMYARSLLHNKISMCMFCQPVYPDEDEDAMKGDVLTIGLAANINSNACGCTEC